MNIFDSLVDYGHEEVLFYSDPKTGLRAIIGVHNTVLGPALGGTRMWNYANDGDALTDVLRLSKGMTYKAAVAGLNLGGGKGVIIGDARTQKSEGLFRAYGKAVESLGRRYITAEDVNTNVRDMSFILIMLCILTLCVLLMLFVLLSYCFDLFAKNMPRR